MIQNLIIIKKGLLLYNDYFGLCHKISDKPHIVSAFIDALISFSREINQGSLKHISFEKNTFLFHRKNEITFILIIENSDNIIAAEKTLIRISELFFNLYKKQLEKDSGEISVFADFTEVLLEYDIVQLDCGDYSLCEKCPNISKPNPVSQYVKDIG